MHSLLIRSSADFICLFKPMCVQPYLSIEAAAAAFTEVLWLLLCVVKQTELVMKTFIIFC